MSCTQLQAKAQSALDQRKVVAKGKLKALITSQTRQPNLDLQGLKLFWDRQKIIEISSLLIANRLHPETEGQ